MATMTTAQTATALETDARTLRKFLRSDASGLEGVGKGSRYAIEKRDIRALKTRFSKWDEARKAPKADNSPEVDNLDTPDA